MSLGQLVGGLIMAIYLGWEYAFIVIACSPVTILSIILFFREMS